MQGTYAFKLLYEGRAQIDQDVGKVKRSINKDRLKRVARDIDLATAIPAIATSALPKQPNHTHGALVVIRSTVASALPRISSRPARSRPCRIVIGTTVTVARIGVAVACAALGRGILVATVCVNSVLPILLF
jgi:hypothetical protein